jgi:hyaluronoglucosaminidase
VRGVIEGFYGPPWSHEARLEMIEFLGAHDMNAYVYAPKDDPKHREHWRDAYDDGESARFRELASCCATHRVRFGFAISPGLDITYGDDGDRAALLSKLVPLLDGGCDWFVLALDDIPARAGLAVEQADLATWLFETLRAQHGELRLTLVPTEYVGTQPSPYLRDLSERLPAELDVMWTGPTVCSPVITADDARAWREAVGGRPMLLWDNTPVNDGVMSHELHLGPYRGREAELSEVLDGVLCNPLVQPRASKIALASAASFLRDPEAFDERASWDQAIEEVGAAHTSALAALARACAYGPLLAPNELHAHHMVDILGAEADGPGWQEAVTTLRDELTALHDAQGAWRDAPDTPIATELAPWLYKARLEADTGLAALRLLQQVRPVVTRNDDGAGRVAAPDAELAMIHAFALVFAWAGVRDAGPEVVLGPRFSFHPAVVQLAGGRPGLDIGLAVHEDGSVIDHLCRLALDHYARWTEIVPEPVRVMTADREVPVDRDGRFSTDPDAMVLVRWGPLATRATIDGRPPFPDQRLQ